MPILNFIQKWTGGFAQKFFIKSIAHRHWNNAIFALENPYVNPAAESNWALRLAVEGGSLRLVDALLTDPRIDQHQSFHHLLTRAIDYQHLPIVKRLLRDPRVNPAAMDQYHVGLAARVGNVQIMEALLNDHRVNPHHSDAIIDAAVRGHLSIVCLLLDRAHVNASVRDNLAVKLAAKNQHWNVVDRLLEEESVQNTLTESDLKLIKPDTELNKME